MPQWVTITISVLKALLTPVIAGIAAYIAYQQYQVNNRKLNFDRFDKRFKVFNAVREMLIRVQPDLKPELAELCKFSGDTVEAEFLFGPDIPAYIDEIVKRALRLRSAKNNYRDMLQPIPPSYDHGKVVTEMHDQEAWFTNQITTGVLKRLPRA